MKDELAEAVEKELKLTIWKTGKGWCVKADGEDFIYVYPSKRSALNALEGELDENYGKE